MLNNPDTLNMILSSPQLKPMLDANPALRNMMSNPQMLQMMLNPQNMQNAMSMLQNQGLGGSSGTSGTTGTTGTTETTGTTGTTGTNPFGNFNFGNLSGFGNLGQGNLLFYFIGFNTNTNVNENVDPREAYKEQNQQLKDMGFINEDLNFETLKKTGGNVDAAVERLLNMLN
jgi:ubiquilin